MYQKKNQSIEEKKNENTEQKKNEIVEKKDNEIIKDSTPVSEIKGRIINIALFGGDRRFKNDISHSDVTIVLSIDTVHNKIKLSSIMMDTYVKVSGYFHL